MEKKKEERIIKRKKSKANRSLRSYRALGAVETEIRDSSRKSEVLNLYVICTFVKSDVLISWQTCFHIDERGKTFLDVVRWCTSVNEKKKKGKREIGKNWDSVEEISNEFPPKPSVLKLPGFIVSVLWYQFSFILLISYFQNVLDWKLAFTGASRSKLCPPPPLHNKETTESRLEKLENYTGEWIFSIILIPLVWEDGAKKTSWIRRSDGTKKLPFWW